MDAFEFAVEVNDVFQGLVLYGVVRLDQGLDLSVYLFWWGGFNSAYFIRKAFVFSYIEPRFSAI